MRLSSFGKIFHLAQLLSHSQGPSHILTLRLHGFDPAWVVSDYIFVIHLGHGLNFSVHTVCLDVLVYGHVNPDALDCIHILVQAMAHLKDLTEATMTQRLQDLKRFCPAVLLKVWCEGVGLIMHKRKFSWLWRNLRRCWQLQLLVLKRFSCINRRLWIIYLCYRDRRN